ncbi:MAG: DUF1499 domain-containing protein [Deltaproteobacteria bacterium]|nr:MAG: DUF1499 domain-containing protein [Deltaproteobacteria bacterium]
MPERSVAATLAAIIGVLAIAAVALGVLGIQVGAFSPFAGFRIFGLGLVPGTLLALVFGGVGLFQTRAGTGRAGRGRAWLGTAIGAAQLAFLVGFGAQNAGVPTIHDITTDLDDPPAFSDALREQRRDHNGVDYPDGGAGVPEAQRAAYPDLAPIELEVAPEIAFERARRSVEALGWTLTRVDPDGGRLEAYDVTRIFGFVDDVVIRVRPRGSGSVVDVRSSSRVGRGDIGANAARIRRFRDTLRAAG